MMRKRGVTPIVIMSFNFIKEKIVMKLSTRFAIVEMTRVKFFGLVVIAGILMWYFCPWLARIISGN